MQILRVKRSCSEIEMECFRTITHSKIELIRSESVRLLSSRIRLYFLESEISHCIFRAIVRNFQ